MNITFTFENVSPEEAMPIQKLINHERYQCAYEGGKSKIKERVKFLSDDVQAEFLDIAFNLDKSDARYRLFKLLENTICKLNKIGEM